MAPGEPTTRRPPAHDHPRLCRWGAGLLAVLVFLLAVSTLLLPGLEFRLLG
ncbi:hypothetical protein [Allostreptomyces psammosilenae]|uniref:Uncharacterized protein n=1 Tax=Allostreptomyces psammosilenae TaxID=1892865 RepID=A0A852ZX85_9ACTN|nr:hypothetical protein [Allostreptomyces psammosilenae]NYI05860.1 hypothetical protein [Allostreptomyces psammosilenae]